MDDQMLRTDEAEDVAGSIRHALLSLSNTDHDPQSWKWALLALHSALQGACVCHLITTATPIGVVSEKDAAKWVAFFHAFRNDSRTREPNTHVMALPELLAAIRVPKSAGDRSNVSGVQLREEEFQFLEYIHTEIRNEFVHFKPLGWSIEVSGITDLAKLVARIVREIEGFGWAFRHKDAAWRNALLVDLKKLEGIT